MSDVEQEYAHAWAREATEATELSEAIGKGLAAVASALLDLAEAVREAVREH